MPKYEKTRAQTDLNTVVISGNVVNPKFFEANGDMRAKLVIRVPVSRDWMDKDDNIRERTTWVEVVAFGKRAEGLVKVIGKVKSAVIKGWLSGVNAYIKDGEAVGTPVITLSDDPDALIFTAWRSDDDQNGVERSGGGNGGSSRRSEVEPDYDDIPF